MNADKQHVPFYAPAVGTYKCMACGMVHKIDNTKTYEQQSACSDDNCDGQRMCNKWPNWKPIR